MGRDTAKNSDKHQEAATYIFIVKLPFGSDTKWTTLIQQTSPSVAIAVGYAVATLPTRHVIFYFWSVKQMRFPSRQVYLLKSSQLNPQTAHHICMR